MRRLDPGDPTDLEVLRALAGYGDQPAFADALAPLPGIPAERVPARLRSLVTLGYADCLLGGKGQADGYRLTARGRVELLRRGGPLATGPPSPPRPGPPGGPA